MTDNSVADKTSTSTLASLEKALGRVTNDRPPLSDVAGRTLLTSSIDLAIDLVIRAALPRASTSPISKLPDELLAEVFYCVVLAEPWSTTWSKKLRRVCRRWNKVALNNPRLWAWVSDHQDHPNVWERRSENSPLAVQIRDKPSARVLYRNIKRVRALDLEVSKNNIIRILNDASALGWTRLEELQVCDSNSYRSPQQGEDEATHWAHIPTSLLEQCSQSLRQLSLAAVFIQKETDWALLRNLTSLELTRDTIAGYEPNDTRIWPSFTQLREVLASSPQLTTLRINRYLNTNDPEEVHSVKLTPVLLSNLTTLDLTTSITTLIRVMTSLMMSPKCHISLHEQRTRVEDSTIDHDFPPYLAQIKALLVPITIHFAQKHIPKLRSATFQCMSSFSFAAWHEAEPHSTDLLSHCRDRRLTPVFQIKLGHSHIQRRFRQVLTKVSNALPMRRLKFFDASSLLVGPRPGRGYVTTATWCSFLRTLPNGLRVRIGVNDAMVEFLRAMVSTIQKSRNKAPSGRRQKWRFNDEREGGIGTYPVSCLELDASYHLQFYTDQHENEGFDMEVEQIRLYDFILDQLTSYRNAHTPVKASGEPLEMLRIFHMRKGSLRAFDVAPQLCEVVENLYFGRRRWDPTEQGNEKITREWDRTKRRMGRRNPRGYSSRGDPEFGDSVYMSSDEEE